jgi:hypothetical protein
MSVLGGRVTDEAGEPISGARVLVMRQAYVDGERRLGVVDHGTTDDAGRYRIVNLAPGAYFVSATLWQTWTIIERDVATVFEVNALPSIELPFAYPSVAPRTLEKIEKLEQIVLERADAIVVPADTIRDLLLARGAKNITVIPNGADLPAPAPRIEERDYFIYIGALQEWQGIETLFRAFARLRDLPVRLVICSSHPTRYAKAYVRLAEKLEIAGRMTWNVALSPDDKILYIADYLNHAIRALDLGTKRVTTVAGNGKAGFANGKGDQAQFNQPYNVKIGAGGRLYVPDQNNHAVRRIDPDGTVSTIAGSGQSGFANGRGADARFNNPTGLIVAADGSIYVADRNNQRLRVVSPGGEVTTIAGDGTEGFQDGTGPTSKFNRPIDIVLTPDGRLARSGVSST